MTMTMKRADRVLLHNISWKQFENLLEDLGESRAARVAYDRGTLEIMTPLPEHEYYKEVIGTSVQDIAEELELNYESFGSTTWRRELKQAGVEPDNCFYFQNESAIRGRFALDLERDPPPDLALEIDLTSKSLNRFPIYARLGVPELWCYDSGELQIYRLQGQEYVKTNRSSVLPMLDVKALPQIIEQHRQEGRRAIRRAVRQWVRNESGKKLGD
jgi:Uma2 family endonuclease